MKKIIQVSSTLEVLQFIVVNLIMLFLQENWEKTIKNIRIPKSINGAIINNKNPTNQQTELVFI